MGAVKRRTTGDLRAAILVGTLLGVAAVALPEMELSWRMVALAALLLPFVLMIAQNVERALVAVILFETSVPLDLFVGFRPDASELSALPGLPISLTTILLGALYATWTLRRLAGIAPADAGLLRAIAPFLAYVAVAAASWLWSRDPQLAVFEIGLLVQMALLFGYLVHAVRSWADLRWYAGVLVAVLLVQSALMAVLVVVGRSVEFGPFAARIDDGSRARVAGTVGSPNTAGAFLTMLLLPVLATWRSAPVRSVRHLAAAGFLLGTAMLVLTLSRGAWLGFVVAMLLFLIVGLRRGLVRTPFAAVVLGLGALVAILLSGPILERLFGPEASPFGDRLALMRIAFEMIGDHPWLGVGANGFAAALPDYLTARFGGTFVNVVHNKYLLVASETGLLGLAAFLAFLVATLRRGWGAVRRLRGADAVLTLGFASAFSGVLAHMPFDLFHGRAETQMLVILAALLTACWRLAARDTQVRTTPT